MYGVLCNCRCLGAAQTKTKKNLAFFCTCHMCPSLAPPTLFVCFTFRRFPLPSSSFYIFFSYSFISSFPRFRASGLLGLAGGKICSWPIPCASAGDRDFRSYPVMDGRSRMGMQWSITTEHLTPSLMLFHCDDYYRC